MGGKKLGLCFERTPSSTFLDRWKHRETVSLNAHSIVGYQFPNALPLRISLLLSLPVLLVDLPVFELAGSSIKG